MSRRKKEYRFEDVQRALRHVYESHDPVVIVVRGHILIENFLETCLDNYLRGGIGTFRGGGFDTKLRLAYAVGLLNDSERDLFDAFNRLRNRLAHHLDAYATDEDELAIKEAFREAGLTDDIGKGPQAYQSFVTLLYCIMAIRSVDIGEKRAPLIGELCNDDYWMRVRETVLAPLIMTMKGDEGWQTLVGVIVYGVIASVSRKAREQRRESLGSLSDLSAPPRTSCDSQGPDSKAAE